MIKKTKVCRICKKRKKIEFFYKASTTLDGYNSMCKSCANKYTVCIRNKSINKIRKYQREYKRKWYSRKKNKLKQAKLSKEYIERKKNGLSKTRYKRKEC